MWRIIGSSPERVRIPDMGDVIYYRQMKDYSDQDYDSSRDLQRAIQRGALTVMEHTATPKSISGSQTAPMYTVMKDTHVDMEAIKQAIRDAMPENKSIGDSLRDMIPSIVNMVRQEISSAIMTMRPAERGAIAPQAVQEPEFVGPEYVPTVTTEGMTSNINIEAKESSGSDVASNLGLLRKLRQTQSK